MGVAALVCAPSCDPSYEAPCRVTHEDTVVRDDAIGGRGAVAVARREGGFVASWVKVDVADAGPDPTPFIASFDVVDLDARGAVVARDTIAAPADLRARKGSVETVGVGRETGATLIHWTESVTSTDPDGRVRTAFSLKGAYGDAVIAPRAAACSQCAMEVAVVALADESLAIVRVAPDVVIAALGTPPVSASFYAVHFRRANDATTVEPLPWLSTIPAASSAPLAAALDGEGHVVITTDGKSWIADRALRPLADPITLPTADARAVWDGKGDPTIAWAISASEDHRSTEQFTKREVFLATATGRERLAVGRAVLGADRKDDELGVVFESAGRMLFATSSPDGKKRGGDVLVRSIGPRASELGAFTPDDATVLAAQGGGRFVVVELGRGALSSAEIVCAP